MKWKYINKIGLEIESCWLILPKSKLIDEIKEDGSLIYSEGHSNHYLYEITSKPLANMTEIKKFLNVVKTNYCENGINKSMGFHIHISFKKKYCYSLVFSRDFVKYFLEKLKEKFPIEFEKRKNNGYCLARYHTRYFYLDVSSLDRYKAINYNAYDRHGTLEIRIFPMNKVEKLLEYVKFTIETIESFIKEQEKKWNRFQTKLSEKENVERYNLNGVIYVKTRF